MKKERRVQTTYRIDVAPEIQAHLSQFSKPEQRKILDALPRQLGFQPTVETRNRKHLAANPIAPGNSASASTAYTSR